MIYIVGGFSTYYVLAFELSTEKARKTSPMNLPRGHAECAASNAELVVCGGSKSSWCRDNVKDVEVYNPETDKYVNLPAPGFKLTYLNYKYSTFNSFEPDSTNSAFTDTADLELQYLQSPLSSRICHQVDDNTGQIHS